MKSLKLVLFVAVLFSSINAFSGEISGSKGKAVSDALIDISNSIPDGIPMGDCSFGKCFINVKYITCLGQSNGVDRVTTCTFFAVTNDRTNTPVAVLNSSLATSLSNALTEGGASADVSLGSTTVFAQKVVCNYNTHQSPVTYSCDLE